MALRALIMPVDRILYHRDGAQNRPPISVYEIRIGYLPAILPFSCQPEAFFLLLPGECPQAQFLLFSFRICINHAYIQAFKSSDSIRVVELSSLRANPSIMLRV
jgi:hypothetical protein